MKRKVPTRKNVWPFSDARTSPRNTTAASGGIAAHSKGAKTKRSKAAVTFKGYRIYSSGEGFKTTPGDGTEFDTVADAKRFISDEVKMARNPAKFEHCVKAVKKRGGAANAYAVCTAVGTRKNAAWTDSVFDQSREGTRVVVVPKGSKWAVLVNGISRMVKPTERGAIGYAERILRNPSRKNPADEAVKGYEDFHGRPPEEFVTIERVVHFHRNLSGAGELKRLVVLAIDGRSVVTLSKFKGAVLAFNEKRNQLFVESGDQAVSLEDFGISPKGAHELETLGRVKKIDYFTTKDHLGDEGGTAVYQHTFRTTNENGKHVTLRIARYPDLIYRVLEKHLEFSGGSYEILPEGIDR